MSRIAAVLCRASDTVQAGGCDDDHLLAALCMERGVDVTFVESLGRIAVGSTDQVCLHGVQGPFVLLCRDGSDTVREQLERLDVRGRLIADGEQTQPAVESRPQRSIFHIRLGPAVDLQRLMQRIHSIRRDVAARVTQIQLPVGKARSSKPMPEPSAAVFAPLPHAVTNAARAAADPRETGRGGRIAAESEQKLDGLIDQLDGFV